MKEVTQAENQAQDLVQKAKENAASILESAKESAKQIVREAKEQAAASAKTDMAKAVEEGELEKKNYASGVRIQVEEMSRQALSRSDAAVDAIVNSLL